MHLCVLQDERYNDLHFWGASSVSADADLMAKYLVPVPPVRRGTTTHATAAGGGSVDASLLATVARKGTLAAAAAGRGHQADPAAPAGMAADGGRVSPGLSREDSPGPYPDFITSYNPFAS